MRTSLLALMLLGCAGDANLGAAPRSSRLDAGRARLDAGTMLDSSVDNSIDVDVDVAPESADALVDPLPTVEIDVELSDDQCATCFDLRARSDTVVGDYTVEWDDGSREQRRHVCPRAPSTSYTVTLLEPLSGRSASSTQSLAARSATCVDAAVPAPQLCLSNGTFSIDSPRSTTPEGSLPASPWLACGRTLPGQVFANRPQIIDSTMTIMGMPVLPAPDGITYLALATYEQASIGLCRPIEAEQKLSFTLHVAEVAAAGADVEVPRLEIWGGRAADCTQDEPLWRSEPLSPSFGERCVTIRPEAFTDNLTLRAVTTSSRAFPGRVLVDHIQPVAACP